LIPILPKRLKTGQILSMSEELELFLIQLDLRHVLNLTSIKLLLIKLKTWLQVEMHNYTGGKEAQNMILRLVYQKELHLIARKDLTNILDLYGSKIPKARHSRLVSV